MPSPGRPTALDDSIIAEGDDWGKNDANLLWTNPSARPACGWQISANRGLGEARNKVLDNQEPGYSSAGRASRARRRARQKDAAIAMTRTAAITVKESAMGILTTSASSILAPTKVRIADSPCRR